MIGTAVVRQVNSFQAGSLGGEDLRELAQRLGVRAVAAPRQERLLVQPHVVAAISPCGTGEPGDDRHTGGDQGLSEVGGFRLTGGLGHLE